MTHRAKVPSRVAIGWAGAGGCIWVAVAAGGSTWLHHCRIWSNGIPSGKLT